MTFAIERLQWRLLLERIWFVDEQELAGTRREDAFVVPRLCRQYWRTGDLWIRFVDK